MLNKLINLKYLRNMDFRNFKDILKYLLNYLKEFLLILIFKLNLLNIN